MLVPLLFYVLAFDRSFLSFFLSFFFLLHRSVLIPCYASFRISSYHTFIFSLPLPFSSPVRTTCW
ncbi:hypothetical protein BDV36DRAFT_254854 [Aspergillus pseudocaelatus]|uniref:Secreted peptide n=1 Tax=Aspergillus pseudocaelatus TaxID=1825620 RepID=A0ABQ6WME8_9EURO|nr:hypothetical protein BDV36DRAFT_254854 [Aspergillus pseudocaelatus]